MITANIGSFNHAARPVQDEIDRGIQIEMIVRPVVHYAVTHHGPIGALLHVETCGIESLDLYS